jgi:hypothetical protein
VVEGAVDQNANRGGSGPPTKPTLRKNVRANGTSPCGTPTIPTV